MAVFSPRKTTQLLTTGIALILTAISTFVVIFLTYGGRFELEQNLLNNKGEFWSAIPVFLTGCVGIIASRCKKSWLVTCYLLGCLASLVLGTLASIQAGIMVLEMRNTCEEGDSGCRNSTVATLLSSVVLVGSLLVCMSVWGGVVACQVKWGPSQHTKFLIASSRYAKGVPQSSGETFGCAENSGYTGDTTPNVEPRSHPHQAGSEVCQKSQVNPTTSSQGDIQLSSGDATVPIKVVDLVAGATVPESGKKQDLAISTTVMEGHTVQDEDGGGAVNPSYQLEEESTKF